MAMNCTHCVAFFGEKLDDAALFNHLNL
jgi:hypothetical protein